MKITLTYTYTHTEAHTHAYNQSHIKTVITFSEKYSTHNTYTQSWPVNIQNTNPLKTPLFFSDPSLPLSISLPTYPLPLTVPSRNSLIPPFHIHLSTFENKQNKYRCITYSQEYYIHGKALANRKVLRLDLNWDNVGKFLRLAGSEFQTDGLMIK